MSFLQAVNVDENFWNLNPEIKYITPFSKLYNHPIKEYVDYSSKVMWAIYMFCDPGSRLSRMSEEEKQKEILSNYLVDSPIENFFDDYFIKELIQGYEDKILTKLQRSYNNLMKKLEERDKFISKTPYNEKNAATLDKMFANSSAIYEQMQAIANELETEKKAGNIKGGRKESLSERKLL